MLYSINQLQEFSQNFVTELQNASHGEQTSFAFARNQIPKNTLVGEGEVFQVIIMGGTHLESALVKKEKGKIHILSFYNEFLPTLATKEIVCHTFLHHLHPEARVVSLNFAYPMQPIIRGKSLDGILIAAPKEHKFVGLLDQTVGLEMEKYVFEKTGRKIMVSVCNDTVALGMAGTSFTPTYQPEHIVAGIVGTGFNFGFFESLDSFINIESGNFQNFEQSYTGKIIDALSTNPGKQYLEKEVGGAYLSKHFNIEAKLQEIPVHLRTTKEMSHTAEKPQNPGSAIAQRIFERSASLVAMEIASIYEFKKQSLGDFNMLCILEGSLFWKGFKFKYCCDRYLEQLGIDLDKVRLESMDKSGIRGAASIVS